MFMLLHIVFVLCGLKIKLQIDLNLHFKIGLEIRKKGNDFLSLSLFGLLVQPDAPRPVPAPALARSFFSAPCFSRCGPTKQVAQHLAQPRALLSSLPLTT